MFALWVLALCGATFGQEWRLVWEDNFDFLDLDKWDHEVTAWGGGNFEFQVYTPSAENSYVKDGKLYIKPTLLADSINPKTGQKYGHEFMDNGVLDLFDSYGRCTSAENGGCYRTGSFGDIPAIQSARLRTAERFAFRYGKAEIRAKMPVGDWMWPAMWMLPEQWVYGGWPTSGEIDIIETIGNRDLKFIGSGEDAGTQKMGSTLHWGVDPTQNRFFLTSEHQFNYERNYGDFFHTYTVEWDENGIVWSVDGEAFYRVPAIPISENPSWNFYDFGAPWNDDRNPWENRPGMAPFDQEFHFLLNVAVGGTNGFIPDNVINRGNNDLYGKPWFNGQDYRQAMRAFYDERNRWLWTWEETEGENSAMQVDYVRVYQRD